MGLMSAAAFEKIIYLIMTVLVARYLTVGDYGRLSFALYFGVIAGVIAEYAVQTILTKELVEDPERHRELVGSALYARILPVAAALLVLFAFAIANVADKMQSHLLLVVGIGQVALAFGSVANAIFRATSKYHLESLAVISRSLLYGLGVSLAMIVKMSILQVGLVILGANVASMVFALALAFRVIPPRLSNLGRDEVIPFLKKATPVAGALFLVALFSGASLVVLRLFSTDTEVGWYNGSHALIAHLAIVPEILMAVLFPGIVRSTHELAREDLGKFDLGEVILIMLVIGVPASVGISTVAPAVLQLIYGDPFVPASPILVVLAWSIPFTFVNFAFLMFFSARNKQRWWLLYVVLSLLVSLGGYAVLVKQLGVLGVAVVRVAGEALLCVVATLHMRRWINGARLALGLVRGGLALLSLVCALTLTRAMPLLVQVMVGMTAYCTLIVIAGPWPRAMWAGYFARARQLLTVRQGSHAP